MGWKPLTNIFTFCCGLSHQNWIIKKKHSRNWVFFDVIYWFKAKFSIIICLIPKIKIYKWSFNCSNRSKVKGFTWLYLNSINMKTDAKIVHSQKITPFLWYRKGAEKAAEFYVSIFPNSKIIATTYYPKEVEEVSGMETWTVMTVDFELDWIKFTAINWWPPFELTPAVSFLVNCDDQKEVDYYWDKLTSDWWQEVECGWLTDKFWLSWQITPSILNEYITDPDPAKVWRVMGEMLKMKKIEIEPLVRAYKGSKN